MAIVTSPDPSAMDAPSLRRLWRVGVSAKADHEIENHPMA
jgi:hypothetical protein